MIYSIIRFMIQYRYVLLALSLVLVVFTAGYYIKSIMAENKVLKAQVDTLQDTVLECESDKALTEEVSSDYQSKVRALNNQLASLKRVRDNPKCVPIAR